MSNNHPAHIYTSLKQLLSISVDSEKARRHWTRMWNNHVDKHGNVPLVLKCSVCSGAELRHDIRNGTYSPRRPSKRLRDEVDPKKAA